MTTIGWWWTVSVLVAVVVYFIIRRVFGKVSEGVRLLAQQMIEHPEDWEQGSYYFSNVKSKDISIWTANGAMFIRLNGNDGFTYAEKRYLNDAIKQSIALKAVGMSRVIGDGGITAVYKITTGITRREL